MACPRSCRRSLPVSARFTAKLFSTSARTRGKRTRLPDLNASDFDAKYLAALSATEPQKRAVAGAGSLAWLITRDKDSGAYSALSDATRRQRDNILKGVSAKAGHHPYKSTSRKAIINGREARASTPAQARNYLDAMRGLFRWALDAELVRFDPTEAVKNPKRQDGEGFVATVEDPANFRNLRAVGAWVGLTPRRYQSGEVDNDGHISRRGDNQLRGLLYEAAAVILNRSTDTSTLRTWALALKERLGFKRAGVPAKSMKLPLLPQNRANGPQRNHSSAARLLIVRFTYP